jgi:hypothetical protein
LNFAFDQRESEVNLHKATSSPELPSNVSPGVVLHILYKILFHLKTKDKVLHLNQCKKNIENSSSLKLLNHLEADLASPTIGQSFSK